MINRDFYKTHRPFDKLRKKRTGSSFDAVDFHGRDINLRSIAGVVEAGRRRDRKAGETNEDGIEEAAERLDAMARADASKEFYEGPKFNAERFAKVHKIDMNLRFDRTYERPDQIVANPPPRVTPPKPKPKPTFQEALYPKQKPAKPSAAAAPVGTVTQKTIPPQSVSQMPITKTSSGAAPAPASASGNDSLRGGAGNDALSRAGDLTDRQTHGNNDPALGEEAKAAYQRELNAARKAAEARGERFNVVEFFKTHGEPMIERAETARAIEEAGETRKRRKRNDAGKNDPIPATGVGADKETPNTNGDGTSFFGSIADAFEDLYDGGIEGYDSETQNKIAILLMRDDELLRLYEEINIGKSADKILAGNEHQAWDVRYYANHPELQAELFAKLKQEHSKNLNRAAQLGQRVLTQENDDISLARETGRLVYPEIWDILSGLVPGFGPSLRGYNKGLGESIVNEMREAGVDMASRKSIEEYLRRREAVEQAMERARKKAVDAGQMELLRNLISPGNLRNLRTGK